MRLAAQADFSMLCNLFWSRKEEANSEVFGDKRATKFKHAKDSHFNVITLLRGEMIGWTQYIQWLVDIFENDLDASRPFAFCFIRAQFLNSALKKVGPENLCFNMLFR